jgi:hypothetical protein
VQPAGESPAVPASKKKPGTETAISNAPPVLAPSEDSIRSNRLVLAPLPPDLASLPAATVMENLQTTFHQYAAMFGGNPVGTNPEITRALQGENPKQINFLKADGNRVNGNGELVDPWGTPYFFHQLSGKQMEIRSAGPDGKMWTADDLVTR